MLEQSREVFGDIPHLLKTIFYIAAAFAFVLFLAGSWLRISVWSKGRTDTHEHVSKKSSLALIKISMLYIFSRDCLFSRKVAERSNVRALMLIFVYWGFLVLFIGTIIVAVDFDLGLGILKGTFYLLYSLVLDIAGGLFIVGLLFLL